MYKFCERSRSCRVPILHDSSTTKIESRQSKSSEWEISWRKREKYWGTHHHPPFYILHLPKRNSHPFPWSRKFSPSLGTCSVILRVLWHSYSEASYIRLDTWQRSPCYAQPNFRVRKNRIAQTPFSFTYYGQILNQMWSKICRSSRCVLSLIQRANIK